MQHSNKYYILHLIFITVFFFALFSCLSWHLLKNLNHRLSWAMSHHLDLSDCFPMIRFRLNCLVRTLYRWFWYISLHYIRKHIISVCLITSWSFRKKLVKQVSIRCHLAKCTSVSYIISKYRTITFFDNLKCLYYL